MSEQRATQVLGYLHTLQDNLCRTFGDEMGGSFLRDAWQRPAGEGKLQGGGITACQEGGATMERAGVALSDVRGSQLPPSATARNPHLAGREFNRLRDRIEQTSRNLGGVGLTPNVLAQHQEFVATNPADRARRASRRVGLFHGGL